MAVQDQIAQDFGPFDDEVIESPRGPINRGVQLLCAWCGPLSGVIMLIGFVGIAQFVPPPHPTDSAAQIRDFYLDDLTSIRIGMLLSIISMALIAPWGAAIVAQTRRMELRGYPILASTQIALLGSLVALGSASVLVWALAAFRPDELAADTTLMLNDFGWFLFLFTFAPFTVWCFVVGLSILLDKRPVPIFPRWAGYLSFWCGALDIPAGMIVFFKTGPFAYNGLMALYVPFVAFLVWLVVMSVLTIKAINKQAAQAAA